MGRRRWLRLMGLGLLGGGSAMAVRNQVPALQPLTAGDISRTMPDLTTWPDHLQQALEHDSPVLPGGSKPSPLTLPFATIGCPRKPSGNMPAAPKPPPLLIRAKPSPRNWPTMTAPTPIVRSRRGRFAVPPQRWEDLARRMILASTTCTVTCWSGAVSTQRRRILPPGESYAVARGKACPSTVGRPIELGSGPIPTVLRWDFAWWLRSRREELSWRKNYPSR